MNHYILWRFDKDSYLKKGKNSYNISYITEDFTALDNS